MLERGYFVSFANWGLPYHIGGAIPDREGLLLQTPESLQVDGPRWVEVPFTLRSGKALAADTAEIAIHFRPLPQYMLDRVPGVEPNVLRVGLTEPYVRLATTLNGPYRRADNRELEVQSTASRRTPYANLILEMLKRDPMFVHPRRRGRGGLAHHRPVMKAWSAGDVPMQDYAAGGPPPSPAF